MKKPGYPTTREFRGKKFLNIATALGIGVTAGTLPFNVNCAEKAPAESKVEKSTESKKVKDQIILLAANLGHDDFKTREESTKTLISMGKKFSTEKNSEMTKFLNSELVKYSKSKDPEVKKRAKMIMIAVTPKIPKRNNPPIMLGEMPAR